MNNNYPLENNPLNEFYKQLNDLAKEGFYNHLDNTELVEDLLKSFVAARHRMMKHLLSVPEQRAIFCESILQTVNSAVGYKLKYLSLETIEMYLVDFYKLYE